jgi:hypothetical protein
LGFSQCENASKLKLGGTYMSQTNNSIPFEVKYKDSIYHEDIFYPFDLKKIEKYSSFILLKAKTYIVNRAGENFFKNIQFESLEVNYPETIKVEYENEDLFKLENYTVKYWVLYTYKNNNIKYAFGLEFDKNGKMISENKFPKFSKNKDFENLTNYCKALELVEKNKRFKNKEVELIKLEYIDKLNSFCWLVEEKMKIEKLGTQEYSIDLYYVNANTNKLESIKKNTGIVTACGFGTTENKN